jgi:hypothetical protein
LFLAIVIITLVCLSGKIKKRCPGLFPKPRAASGVAGAALPSAGLVAAHSESSISTESSVESGTQKRIEKVSRQLSKTSLDDSDASEPKKSKSKSKSKSNAKANASNSKKKSKSKKIESSESDGLESSDREEPEAMGEVKKKSKKGKRAHTRPLEESE